MFSSCAVTRGKKILHSRFCSSKHGITYYETGNYCRCGSADYGWTPSTDICHSNNHRCSRENTWVSTLFYHLCPSVPTIRVSDQCVPWTVNLSRIRFWLGRREFFFFLFKCIFSLCILSIIFYKTVPTWGWMKEPFPQRICHMHCFECNTLQRLWQQGW